MPLIGRASAELWPVIGQYAPIMWPICNASPSSMAVQVCHPPRLRTTRPRVGRTFTSFGPHKTARVAPYKAGVLVRRVAPAFTPMELLSSLVVARFSPPPSQKQMMVPGRRLTGTWRERMMASCLQQFRSGSSNAPSAPRRRSHAAHAASERRRTHDSDLPGEVGDSRANASYSKVHHKLPAHAPERAPSGSGDVPGRRTLWKLKQWWIGEIVSNWRAPLLPRNRRLVAARCEISAKSAD